MIKAPNPISGIRIITLILLLALAAIAENMNAQQLPGLPHILRITVYREKDLIRGYAAPFSTIKFYYADPGSFNKKQPDAQPIKTVTADENGSWLFSPTFDNMGEFTGPVVVSMTPFGGTTEVFESPTLSAEEVFILDPQPCADKQTIVMRPGVAVGGPDGVIPNWRDQSGNIVSHEPSLRDATPGTYTLDYTNVAGRTYKSRPVTFEGRPQVLSRDLFLECSETYLDYTGVYSGSEAGASFLWINKADGSTVGITQRVRLPAGQYNFYVTNEQGCQSEPATITVNPLPAAATIDIGASPVKNADCNQSNGSITGIRVFAASNQNPVYRWRDTKGNTFNTIDLYNLPPDRYILEAFTAANPCPAILADLEVQEENSVKLDQGHVFTSATSCGLNNGSITGLKSNASGIKWYNREHPEIILSTAIELKDVPPGFYMLKLTNNVCVEEFGPFHIVEGSPAVELTSNPVIKDDNCHLGQGSISGITFNTPVTCIWLNAAGEEVGRNKDLLNAPAGNYTLIASNDKCQNSYNYTIGNNQSLIAPPVMDDILVCSASEVKVTFREMAGIYRIYNAEGTLVAQSTSKDFKIRAGQPGVYYATLASGGCESSRASFNINFGASGLQIPTVFSPNGDGVNDKWIIKGLDVYTSPEIKIFNRQGQVVFHSYDNSQPFEGKSKGKELPVGVYYYLVSASPECPAASGSLSLIR